MKALHSPVGSSNADATSFDGVVSASRKPHKPNLLAVQQAVRAAYLTYQVNLNQPGAFNPVPMNQLAHDSYYFLYDSTGKATVSVKKIILDKFGKGFCPYCSISVVEDLDHFLPRSVFPEFSTSLQNLVPACGICNSDHKKTIWGNMPIRPFLHPYFDNLPQVDFLVCDVTVVPRALEVDFSIKNLNGIAPAVLAHIQRHFENFDLNKRYKQKVTLEGVPKVVNIVTAETVLQRRIARANQFIRDQIQASTENTWDRAFYVGLLPHLNAIAGGNWP